MAAEAGHDANRVYRSQDGKIHLNGGEILNRNEEGMEVFSGTVSPSSSGVATFAVPGASGFRSVTANLKSTTLSTAAGVADQVQVGFASNSSSIDLVFSKPTSSAVPQRIAATSTANVASWTAIGI